MAKHNSPHWLPHCLQSFEVLDAVYLSGWYEYPVRYQRYVGLIMARMQRPIVLTGYDMVYCNLPTFTMVWRTQYVRLMPITASLVVFVSQVLRTVGSVIAVFQSME